MMSRKRRLNNKMKKGKKMNNEKPEINLDKIKEMSKLLLRSKSVEEADIGYGIASHPFTNNVITLIPTSNGFKMIDLRNNKEQQEWMTRMEKEIDEANDILKIYMMINKPYILLWLKLIKIYVSNKIFSEYLADAWVRSENPNQDVNVKISEIAKWFKEADKESIMNDDEYNIWINRPSSIKLYRGVGKGRAIKGLSWTDDYNKAEWFANRWNYQGKVYMIEAKKEDILCYFKGEMEYVINPKNYKMIVVNRA